MKFRDVQARRLPSNLAAYPSSAQRQRQRASSDRQRQTDSEKGEWGTGQTSIGVEAAPAGDAA